jgi:cellulose synthase/poly-beta-1,6-N-acetylglucosamine synthase-like glycosyltransferase
MQDFFYLIVSAGLFYSLFRGLLTFILKTLYPEKLKVRQDYAYEPTVSILLPSYNEGKTVYETMESICKSDYPVDRFEIIGVDDCSVDNSYEYMLKAQTDFPQVRMRLARNDENSGKVKSVERALAQSEADVIISIDSDCIFHPQVIRELVSCLADPEIGAVGGQVGIRNASENWYTMGQVLWYYLAFNFIKTPEIWAKATTCISGCLFCIRRDLMLKIMPVAVNRMFLGAHVIEGEDRFMTHMVLLNGYKNFINVNAKCWTTAPAKFTQLFKQQLRWRRSALRDIFFTLTSIPHHLKTVPLYYTYTVVMSFVMMVLATLTLLTAPFQNIMFWLGFDRWVWGLGLAAAAALIVKAFAPEQHISNPVKLFAFSAWVLVDCVFLTTLALCTLDIGDWGTRDKTEEYNAI